MKLVEQLIKYNKKDLKYDAIEQVNNILSELENDEIQSLKEAGFQSAIEAASNDTLQNKYKEYKNNIVDKFGREKLFTKDAIKKIAVNYGLRFLPTSYYKGIIPPELGLKIKEVKKDITFDVSDCFILAPKHSFKLEARPKDPLFFIKMTMPTGEELYYLVHSWGSEINSFRYIKNLPFRTNKTFLCCFLITFIFLFLISLPFFDYSQINVFISNEFIYSVISFLISFIFWVSLFDYKNGSNETIYNSEIE